LEHKIRAVLFAGVGALAAASSVYAEESTTPPPAQPPAGAASESTKLEEITVTGSRLIRSGLNSPTPLTSVAVDDLSELHPGTLGNQLNDLPIFDASRGQSTNAGNGSLSSGPTAPNPSANVLNLRNMGYQRTLILFDGKRVPPTSPDGAVDINMIPQLLLQRVETVTGGASAVYGSDAMSGVVNFITDTKFTGLKVNAFSGLSHDHDDFTHDEGIAWGTKLFDGRGHLEVSFENRGDPQVLLRNRRQWGRDVWTVQGLGTAADPFHLVENTRISTSTFGGLITNGALSGQQFASNGVLSPFVNGAATGTSGYQSGGGGAYYNSSFKASQQLDQLFARLDYDFTDSVHGDVTLAGTYNHNASVQTSNVLNNVTLSTQDAFLSPTYQAALAAGPPTFKFSKAWTDVPPSNTDTWERQYFANMELRGEFGGGYVWDAWYTHSETRQTTRQNANINNERLAAALDAVVDPATGQTVCNVTLTNPGLYPGCAPLNVFGPSAESQAAINYIVSPTQFLSTQKMDDVSASVTGEPLHDWAGPINVALSGEWRKLSWELSSDATPSDPVSCTGLRYNCSAATLLWAVSSTPDRSPVNQAVSEGALELNVPLLKDVFLAKDVSVNGAARYTDYNTSGSAVTWKGGIDWQINNQLTLRATRSRDIRAPNLDDLYYPQALSTITVTDLLTKQTPANVPLQGGGNPNLVPEVGYTTTAGFVYRPQWLTGFSVTLDGYWIDVTNAITNLQGTNPVVQGICYASGGASPYCLLQRRPNGFTDTAVANTVTEWFNEEINIANQSTKGADLEANYSTTVFSHPLSLRFFETYQPHLIQKVPGLPTVDLAGVAFYANAVQATPVYRWAMTATYSPVQNFTISVMERWRSSLAWTPTPATQIVSTPRIPSVGYTNLNLAYQVNPGDSQLEVFFNVQNLLNKQPPPGAYLGSNGAVGQFGGFVYGDDPIGAYFTLGVRLRL
jgi:iron complex outermembrane receptor protein